MLVNNQAISVENWGTISPYIYLSHKSRDIKTQKLFDTKPTKRIKFRTHSVFQDLIDAKKPNGK